MIILDNGHGGMIDGVYQTPGKRSPVWDDGTQYFEGVGNREIVNKLHNLCKRFNIDSHILVPEQQDITLGERVRRVNKIHKYDKDAILISIHSNAFSDSQANGFEIFTSVGQTKSDEIAKVIHNKYLLKINNIKDRGIKEENFYLLKNSNCPAILIETMFHTNYVECKRLMNEQDDIVLAIFDGILEITKNSQPI